MSLEAKSWRASAISYVKRAGQLAKVSFVRTVSLLTMVKRSWPKRHGIKCDLVSEVVFDRRKPASAEKLNLMGEDLLTRKNRRSQPRFNVGLPAGCP